MSARRFLVFSAARDEAIVDRLAAALSPRGITFVHDRSRPGGGAWDRRVAEAARGYDRLVMVWSSATADEPIWAPFAADGAARLRLVLVMAQKTAVPAALADVPRVDLTRWRGAPDYPAIARLALLLLDDAAPPAGRWQRLYRNLKLRVLLLSGTFGICIPCAMFALNVFGAQESLCSLSLLSDRCGEWKLGGRPTREERLAWKGLDRSDPEALQRFITDFDEGAYHGAAADLLEACRPVPKLEWAPHRSTLPLSVSRFLAAAAGEADARALALRLARDDATRSCTAHGHNEGFRFTGRFEIRLDAMSCSPLDRGVGCDANGWVDCAMLTAKESKRLTCSGTAGAPGRPTTLEQDRAAARRTN